MQKEEDQGDTKTVNNRKRRKMERSIFIWNRPSTKYDDYKSQEGSDNSVNTVNSDSEMIVEAGESLENLDSCGTRTPESQPPHQMMCIPMSPIVAYSNKSLCHSTTEPTTKKWNIIQLASDESGTPFPSVVNDYSYYGRQKPQHDHTMSSSYQNGSTTHSARDNSRRRMEISHYDREYKTKSSSKSQTLKGGGFHNGWNRGLNPRHRKDPSPERSLNTRDALSCLYKEGKNPSLKVLDYVHRALLEDPNSNKNSERAMDLLTTILLHTTNSSCASKILIILHQNDNFVDCEFAYEKVVTSALVR